MLSIARDFFLEKSGGGAGETAIFSRDGEGMHRSLDAFVEMLKGGLPPSPKENLPSL